MIDEAHSSRVAPASVCAAHHELTDDRCGWPRFEVTLESLDRSRHAVFCQNGHSVVLVLCRDSSQRPAHWLQRHIATIQGEHLITAHASPLQDGKAAATDQAY